MRQFNPNYTCGYTLPIVRNLVWFPALSAGPRGLVLGRTQQGAQHVVSARPAGHSIPEGIFAADWIPPRLCHYVSEWQRPVT